MPPLFIATERFDPSDAETWRRYVEWARVPNLREVVSLDCMLCPRIVRERNDEDWKHIVCEDHRLDYFLDLDYLMKRVAGKARRNVLGLYRNADRHIDDAPASSRFEFLGYDLIEEATQISALCNCGGFSEIFSNEELNLYGLVRSFDRALEIRKLLLEKHPEEHHANCEMYAIWRLDER